MQVVKIKLTVKELQLLQMCYVHYIALWESENAHEDLLLEHLCIMCGRISSLTTTERKNYTLKMNTAEAVAMYQVWQMIDTAAHNTVFHNLICRVLGDIDRLHINRKILIYEENH